MPREYTQPFHFFQKLLLNGEWGEGGDSWRKVFLALAEILANLEGRTPNTSNMISLLQENCVFSLTHLSLRMNSH